MSGGETQSDSLIRSPLLAGLLSVRAALSSGYRDLFHVLIDENRRFDRSVIDIRRSA